MTWGRTTNLVLHCDALWLGQSEEDLLKVSALLQGEEPDEASHSHHANGIEDQCPVEYHETDGNVIGLDDGTHG